MGSNFFYDPSEIPSNGEGVSRIVIPGVTDNYGSSESSVIASGGSGIGNPINTIDKVIWLKPEGVKVELIGSDLVVTSWQSQEGIELVNEDPSLKTIKAVKIGEKLQAIEFNASGTNPSLFATADLGLAGLNKFIYYALIYQARQLKGSFFDVNGIGFGWIQSDNYRMQTKAVEDGLNQSYSLNVNLDTTTSDIFGKWILAKLSYYHDTLAFSLGSVTGTATSTTQRGGFGVTNTIRFPNNEVSGGDSCRYWVGEILITADFSTEEALDSHFGSLLSKYQTSTVVLT